MQQNEYIGENIRVLHAYCRREGRFRINSLSFCLEAQEKKSMPGPKKQRERRIKNRSCYFSVAEKTMK